MRSLSDAAAGGTYRITWIVGALGKALKELFRLDVDEQIQVLQKTKRHVVVRCSGRKIVMSSDAAFSVKVIAI